MRELFAAAGSQNPYQVLANDYLPGNVTASSHASSSTGSMSTSGSQSQSQMAKAVGQTLGQFGVNFSSYEVPNDAQQGSLNRFYIVQFVGNMFQMLSGDAPDPSVSSPAQMLSAYAQGLSTLSTAVQAQLKADGADPSGAQSQTSQRTPIETLIGQFERVAPDQNNGQTLVNFLQALSANVGNDASGDPTGVFVQTTA